MEIESAFDLGAAFREGSGDVPAPEAEGKSWDRAALEAFCRDYRDRVFRFASRAWPSSPEDAEDLTQAFFLWILETNALARYSPGRGGFWPFLKSLLRHFSADRHDAHRALKRGGGVRTLSLDRVPAAETVSAAAPDEPLDRAWERESLRRAVERSRQWHRASGRALQFRVFEEHDLRADGTEPTYAETTGRLGIRESQVRNYLFGVRERIRRDVRSGWPGGEGRIRRAVFA